MAHPAWHPAALAASVAASLTATVIVAVFITVRPHGESPPEAGRPPVVTQQPTEALPTSNPYESSAGITSTPSQSPTAAASSVLLTAEQAVNSSGDVDLDVTATMSQKTYLHSIVYRCDLFCNDPTGSVQYTVPPGARTFSATVGVTDDAEEPQQTGVFEVYFDGSSAPAKTWQATLNAPVQVRIGVAGHAQIRLVAGRSGTVAGGPAQAALAGANMAAGVSNGLPSLAWGDPEFIP